MLKNSGDASHILFYKNVILLSFHRFLYISGLKCQKTIMLLIDIKSEGYEYKIRILLNISSREMIVSYSIIV